MSCKRRFNSSNLGQYCHLVDKTSDLGKVTVKNELIYYYEFSPPLGIICFHINVSYINTLGCDNGKNDNHKKVTKEHYTKWATESDTHKKIQQSTHQHMLMSLATVEFIVKNNNN